MSMARPLSRQDSPKTSILRSERECALGAFTNLLNHPQLSAAPDERHGVLVWRGAERADGRKQR